MIIVTGIGSQSALGAWLTAVPRLMNPYDPHRERLKQVLDDVALGVVEVATAIRVCEGSQIAHSVNKKLRVRRGVSVSIRGETSSLDRFRGVQKVVREARLSNRNRSPQTARLRVLRRAEPAFRR